MASFEVKANELKWDVLIVEKTQHGTEIVSTVSFSGKDAEKRAKGYAELHTALELGLARLILTPLSERQHADLQHVTNQR